MISDLPPEFVKQANDAVTKCIQKVDANFTECQQTITESAANTKVLLRPFFGPDQHAIFFFSLYSRVMCSLAESLRAKSY